MDSLEKKELLKDLLEKGEKSFEKNDLKQAQKFLSEYLEIDTSNAHCFYLLGQIFHTKGKIGKAIKAFQKVLEINPAHTDSAISLSVLYNDIGRYDEAKTLFDKANQQVKSKVGERDDKKRVNKIFSMKHFELAELYTSYERFDEALFEYEKAIGLDPENLDFRLKLSKLYAKKGFQGKARELLKQIINESPSYEPARLALGVLYYAYGNIIEAQNEWKKALAKNPQSDQAQSYLTMAAQAKETNLEILG